MEIGKPKRIYRVEPLRNPVPATPKRDEPVRQPAPAEPAPAPAP